MSLPKPVLAILSVAVITLPGLGAALTHQHLSPPLTAVLAGAAILAASFLLLWSSDAAQADISQALALAGVALVAVLPEYAVDMYFTWQAGKFPQSEYAEYAIANMTGANRLIIGVAWAVVVAIFWLKARRAVQLQTERLLEIRFLAAASTYALVIPLKGSLAWYDGVVFVGMYVWYMILAGRRPAEEPEVDGPGAYLVGLTPARRRAATIAMFLFAAGVIIANAERFCEGLVGTGKVLGVSEFLLVQWLAPIASEAPEFVVAIMFALRGQAGTALGSLLSAKLNQWTLLVGMIPGVFAVSSGSLVPPLPMNSFQLQEILLTAAQSLLAVVMLCTLRLNLGQALLLFWLFAAQLVAPMCVTALPGQQVCGLSADQMHTVFSFLYLITAFGLVVDRPLRLAVLFPRRGRAHDPACDVCGQVAEGEAVS